ncbi:MAG: substrate-binding domain-containing protein [Phycisphaerales bacterium]|nr:substrate-binding domain-containing protein [Phycisphaerales bacterium]
MNIGNLDRRRVLGLGLVGVAAAMLSACGNNSGGGGTNNAGGGAGNNGARPRYQIGVIAKSSGNAVFQAARQGAVDAARDLGQQMGCDVEIIWKTPNNEDAQQQAQYIEQLASQGVDGIAISCTDANIVTPAIDNAVDQGVTVVTFDSDAAASRRMCYYGVDDYTAGRKVMELLAERMGGEGVVAVLAGNQAAPNLQARVRGVREEAGEHDGIQILDVYYHVETPSDAVARMQQVQTANPQITGWALVGGWPLYTDSALDGIHENAAIVSMDPLELPLNYMISGQVDALVGQPYYDWGYESVRLILNKVHHNENPAQELITVEPDVVASVEAAEALKGRWSRWLSGAGSGGGE